MIRPPPKSPPFPPSPPFRPPPGRGGGGRERPSPSRRSRTATAPAPSRGTWPGRRRAGGRRRYPRRWCSRRSEEHTSELQSQSNLVCRLLLEKKKTTIRYIGCPTTALPHSRSNRLCAQRTSRDPRLWRCTVASRTGLTHDSQIL